MIKKILPYALTLMLGVTTAYCETGIQIGRDKTPKTKATQTQTQVQKSSPTPSGLENKTKEISFYYTGKSNPSYADNTISNVICPQVSQILEKKVDCDRLGKWIKTEEERYGPKDVTVNLVVDKEKSNVCFKGTDNCYPVIDNSLPPKKEEKKTEQTKLPEEKKSGGWIQGVRGGVGTLEDCTGWNAGVNFNGWGISYTRATKGYDTVSNPGSSSGNRFAYTWDSTIKRDDTKENISLDINLIQSKNKGAKLFTGPVYKRFTKDIDKDTMEQILDKNTGTVLAKDSNSIDTSTIEEAKQLELGVEFAFKKGFLKGFGVRAVEYFGEGMSTTFSGSVDYTYSISK